MTEELYKRELETLKEDFNDLKLYLDEIRDILPISICTLNVSLGIVDVNKTTVILTGYKPLEIIGHPIDLIFREKEKLEKIKEKLGESKKLIAAETVLTLKNKKEIPVTISMVGRKDAEGNIIGYFLTFTDITETKKYQNQLERRTKELNESRAALMNILEDVDEARRKAEEEANKTLSIINNFADGLLVFDKENKLSLINPQAENFFDIEAKDVIGRPILELSTFPTIKPVVDLTGKEIKEVFRKEVQIEETLILEISTISIMRGDEKTNTLIILHDVTREKMIEKMKTEFVSISAHQLRTPLSAIKWTLRMLLDGDLGEISPEQRNFLEKTYRSNERMISLINDLLDVTRIEEGRHLYKPILSDFEPVVQFVINSYKEEFEKKKLEFWFNKPEKKMPQVMIDVEKVRLAVQNLLDNALRYTSPGGKVIISLRCVKKEIEFSVQDTGVGIPKDQQDRIFSKFFRGANVLRMETEGSGLGLFITKNIIEAHGGKIWFESQEGRGTTFYFTLPIKEEFGEFLKKF